MSRCTLTADELRLVKNAARTRPFCLRQLTLDEIAGAIVVHKRRIAGSLSVVWRFFQRHKISFKKSAGGRARAGGRGARTAPLDARARHV